jgi:deoxyhypusine synthase
LKREEPLPADKIEDVRPDTDLFTLRKNNCTIFLGYTSNMASCGVRETIRFLVQHKMVKSIEVPPGILSNFWKRENCHDSINNTKFENINTTHKNIFQLILV